MWYRGLNAIATRAADRSLGVPGVERAAEEEGHLWMKTPEPRNGAT